MGYISFVLGVYVLICTLTKPKFFWGSKKATRLRQSIGDHKTAVVYYIIAIVALLVGVLGILGIINFD